MEIDFPKDKRIGVMVSGGIDSTILYYLVAKKCQERGQTLIPLTAPKPDGSADRANKMVKWMHDRYGFAPTENVIIGEYFDTDESDVLCVARGVQSLFDGHLVDIVMTAENPYDFNAFKIDPLFFPKKPRTFELYDGFEQKTEGKLIGICPFRNLYKDDILQIVKDQKDYWLKNFILDETWSCVTPNVTEPCNICFWCVERHWAIEKVFNN